MNERIGELLVRENLLSADQLNQASVGSQAAAITGAGSLYLVFEIGPISLAGRQQLAATDIVQRRIVLFVVYFLAPLLSSPVKSQKMSILSNLIKPMIVCAEGRLFPFSISDRELCEILMDTAS